MGLNLTKMSKNGQVVIPLEIRKQAKIKPATKLLVVNRGETVILRKVTEEEILHEFDVMEQIDEGEKAIDEGRYLSVDTSMSAEEIDDLIMSS